MGKVIVLYNNRIWSPERAWPDLIVRAFCIWFWRVVIKQIMDCTDIGILCALGLPESGWVYLMSCADENVSRGL